MGHCLVKTQAIQLILAMELDRKCQINMETLMLTDHLLTIRQCFKKHLFELHLSLQIYTLKSQRKTQSASDLNTGFL